MIKLVLLMLLGMKGGGFGGFQISYIKPRISPLNELNKKYGLSEFGDILSYGGGGYAIIGKIIIGGMGFGGNKTVKNDTLKVRYSAGGGFFEMGYEILDLGILTLYPMLGIGGYGETIEIFPTRGDINWNDFYTASKRFSAASSGGFTLSPQISLLVFPSNFFIGIMIKAGSTLRLSKTWKLSDGYRLLDTPEFDNFVPHVDIMIFWGGKAG